MGEIKILKVKATDESMQAVNDFIHSMIPSDCDDMSLFVVIYSVGNVDIVGLASCGMDDLSVAHVQRNMSVIADDITGSGLFD